MYEIDLKDVFANRQEELRVRLARARSLPHPTSAGDEGEEGWTEVLRDFLPRRYDVARHRFVIDAEGRVSQQQDIVIYDGQFAPTFLVLGETQFIPVESVYAVLEVKTTMNKETVVYAGEKAASVRHLTHNPGKVLIYTGELAQRAPIRPIAGLLCHDSDWADPFGEHFEGALAGLSDDARLDMGCVALKGAFSVGVDAVVSANTDKALIAFCVALFDSLQKLGNAPGIDAIKYGKELWKNHDASGTGPSYATDD
jgi:hypothetical protein